MKKLISTTAIAILSIGMISCSQPQTNTAQDTQTDTTVVANTESANSPQNKTEVKNKENIDSQSKSEVTRNSANSEQNSTEANQKENTAESSKSQAKTNSANSRETRTQSKTNSTKQAGSGQLEVGTVKNIVQGDIICYVTLVDEKGKTHEVSADFDICANQETFLKKKVRLSYELANLNDCQSAEPCGKTRQETIISKMEIIGENSPTSTKNKDSQTLSNGEWTITIGNGDSWNGVNGTGNLSYNGCDAKGKCIKLEGGKVTCRDGKCVMGWSNGDYSYIIEQPITDPDSHSSGATTLTVRKGATIILNATGFKGV
ncbi:hypothetical protein [Limnofasciculus baicalensis]|uniref:Lipoprotein n=1 Tax=Limnofasciculus baicalensis BBK-W-15 TaxID=2699891 RepID=A0AAE3GUE8_9CYAN|nr:hypothetical protein [Limnofasciculus baicalensis]MCP2730856.1 hypothetical protein [Limnofasciculus baicalensis BBK-W-15]